LEQTNEHISFIIGIGLPIVKRFPIDAIRLAAGPRQRTHLRLQIIAKMAYLGYGMDGPISG
jgi:hypothetical protein